MPSKLAAWLPIVAAAGCTAADPIETRSVDAGAADVAVASTSDASPADTSLDAGHMPGDAGESPPPPIDTLFIGNSYVTSNDVSGRYRAILEGLGQTGVRVERVAPGGHRLQDHADDAHMGGTPLAGQLRSSSFDVVVLQEQSILGAMPNGFPERIESVDAATELAAMVEAESSTVVLYMTWGRERGYDAPFLGFGSFEGHQEGLDVAYESLAEHLRAQGLSTVRIAPVGAAFRAVFDRVTAAGDDPLAEGSDFDALYHSDGSHPSAQGAYLAACVIAGVATGDEPLDFADDPELGAGVSAELRSACQLALHQVRWHGRPQAIERAVIDPGVGIELGRVISANEDGSTVLISNSDGLGPMVFTRTGTSWSVDARLEVDAASTMCLSRDGTRAVVTFSGNLHIFRRDATDWVVEAVMPRNMGNSPVGFGAVALDASAELLFAGYTTDTSTAGQTGSVRVFRRTGETWTAVAKLVPDDAEEGDSFGSSVAVDATAERVLIGAMSDDVRGITSGSARLYRRTPNGWTEHTRFDGPRVYWAKYGWAVALDAAGDRAAVGTRGEIEVFTRAKETWTHEALLPANLWQPFLAWDDDATRILFGESELPTAAGVTGRAQTYVRTSTTWQLELLLLPKDGAGFEDYGYMNAMSADGSTAFIGAPNNGAWMGNLAGRVHIFDLPR